MTVNDGKRNHHDLGYSPVPVGQAVQAETTLESVCRQVRELTRSAPTQPRRIRLRHGQTTVEVQWPNPEQPPGQAPAPSATGLPAAAANHPPGQKQRQEEELRYVTAGRVGTFYRCPEPGAPPFVTVGDVVRLGQTVGLIEVMKMLFPIEADTDGRIVEILISDTACVEFNEPLITIEPHL
ncbi:acetyl-CoA carboxylase biotin carboxyl carrier protein [Streptomyces pathocidini]|uniref:Biotin carboxyl carrier protein of acetyl-CoA carboxylase n=1 Tax=Streptomyces pathocidini TaxID=1650571 RepID=A0ABW7V0Q6_9ACTN|nr:biotin/lipoyl-containing protein [Streptomyces pathocidini]